MPRLYRHVIVCFLAVFGSTPTYGLTVFAAASLKNVLEEVVVLYERPVSLSFGGSSMLARQIEYGAPADVFISANAAWMDRLEARSLIQRDSRYDLVGNSLVLIGSKHEDNVTLEELSSVDGKVAMALVTAVPAGVYGKAALHSLNLWETFAPRVVQTDNVRAALTLVATQEVRFGIVYATDVGASDDVRVVARFPSESHPPIRYPAALTHQADPEAQKFMEFLSSPRAEAILVAHGFLKVRD